MKRSHIMFSLISFLILAGLGLYLLIFVPEHAETMVGADGSSLADIQSETIHHQQKMNTATNREPESKDPFELEIHGIISDVYGDQALPVDFVVHDPSAEDDFLFLQAVRRLEGAFTVSLPPELINKRLTLGELTEQVKRQYEQ